MSIWHPQFCDHPDCDGNLVITDPSVLPITIAYWVEVWGSNMPDDGFWVKFTGDKRHWNEVYINSDASHLAHKEIVSEMLKAAYDEEGSFLLQKISRFVAETSVQEGAYLISCGILL